MPVNLGRGKHCLAKSNGMAVVHSAMSVKMGRSCVKCNYRNDGSCVFDRLFVPTRELNVWGAGGGFRHRGGLWHWSESSNGGRGGKLCHWWRRRRLLSDGPVTSPALRGQLERCMRHANCLLRSRSS